MKLLELGECSLENHMTPSCAHLLRKAENEGLKFPKHITLVYKPYRSAIRRPPSLRLGIASMPKENRTSPAWSQRSRCLV